MYASVSSDSIGAIEMLYYYYYYYYYMCGSFIAVASVSQHYLVVYTEAGTKHHNHETLVFNCY